MLTFSGSTQQGESVDLPRAACKTKLHGCSLLALLLEVHGVRIILWLVLPGMFGTRGTDVMLVRPSSVLSVVSGTESVYHSSWRRGRLDGRRRPKEGKGNSRRGHVMTHHFYQKLSPYSKNRQ